MKKGFTLTEILITMGIIGVVAALAVPNISAKINRNTIGVTLARAVELTETGIASMMNVARENAGQFGIDPGSVSTISTIEQRFLNPNIVNNGDNLIISDVVIFLSKSYLGLDVDNSYEVPNFINDPDGVDLVTYRFKKNNIVLMEQIGDTERLDANNINTDPDTVIMRIYFDINGANNPNELGKDIFLFGLTDSGHLVPAGSQAYNHNTWNVNGNNNLAMTCNGDTIPNGNDANGNDRRLSCAARVVQDGWRVNYSF